MTVPSMRRGWCPGLRRPMATGDGLLARLHPPGGALSAAQARTVAAAARACGNGLVDVTGRGNLQLRGLRGESHAELMDRLAAVGLLEAVRPGPIRLTVVSPLAGCDPTDLVDARALADAIEAQGRAVAGLPDKLCVAVDGGGALRLDDVEADLRIVAFGPRAAPILGVGVGTEPHWLGATTPARAPAAVRAILARFAVLLHEGRSPARRMKALPADLRADLGEAGNLAPLRASPPRRDRAPRAGIIPLREGKAAVLAALPFGRCDAQLLDEAACWSERYGTGELRFSPWRGFAVAGVARRDLPALVGKMRALGLILDDADPRLSLFACPGHPACARASTDTHADAARLAEAARTALARGATIHVSGCAKGCAHPGAADLTLIGDQGRYRIAAGKAPGGTCSGRLSIGEILQRSASAQGPGGLVSAFKECAA